MKVRLDLSGLDGNAFSLMGAFKKPARQQGFDNRWIAHVIAKCMESDYDHLVDTLMENITGKDKGNGNEI